jgi:hypothetical protein
MFHSFPRTDIIDNEITAGINGNYNVVRDVPRLLSAFQSYVPARAENDLLRWNLQILAD